MKNGRRLLLGSVRVACLLGLSACIVPMGSKTLLDFSATVDAVRVVHKKQGTLLILSAIPTAELLDIKTEMEALKAGQKCAALKNVDIQYYQQSFAIVGFEQLVLRADCVKGAPAP